MKTKNQFYAEFFMAELDNLKLELEKFAMMDNSVFGYDYRKDEIDFGAMNAMKHPLNVAERLIGEDSSVLVSGIERAKEYLDSGKTIYPFGHPRPSFSQYFLQQIEYFVEQWEIGVMGDDQTGNVPISDIWKDYLEDETSSK